MQILAQKPRLGLTFLFLLATSVLVNAQAPWALRSYYGCGPLLDFQASFYAAEAGGGDPQACQLVCLDLLGKKFAALGGRECFCSNDLHLPVFAAKPDEAACTNPCLFMPHVFCGGLLDDIQYYNLYGILQDIIVSENSAFPTTTMENRSTIIESTISTQLLDTELSDATEAATTTEFSINTVFSDKTRTEIITMWPVDTTWPPVFDGTGPTGTLEVTQTAQSSENVQTYWPMDPPSTSSVCGMKDTPCAPSTSLWLESSSLDHATTPPAPFHSLTLSTSPVVMSSIVNTSQLSALLPEPAETSVPPKSSRVMSEATGVATFTTSNSMSRHPILSSEFLSTFLPVLESTALKASTSMSSSPETSGDLSDKTIHSGLSGSSTIVINSSELSPSNPRSISASAVSVSSTFPTTPPTIEMYTYQGCLSSPNGISNFEILADDEEMTLAACVSMAQGRPFAGVHQTLCFGADFLEDTQFVSGEQCNLACPGNSAEACGGLLSLLSRSAIGRRQATRGFLYSLFELKGAPDEPDTETPSPSSLPVLSDNGDVSMQLRGFTSTIDFTRTVTFDPAATTITVEYSVIDPLDSAQLMITGFETTVQYLACNCAEQKFPRLAMTTLEANCNACGEHGENTVLLTIPRAALALSNPVNAFQSDANQNHHWEEQFGNSSVFHSSGDSDAVPYIYWDDQADPTSRVRYTTESTPDYPVVTSGSAQAVAPENHMDDGASKDLSQKTKTSLRPPPHGSAKSEGVDSGSIGTLAKPKVQIVEAGTSGFYRPTGTAWLTAILLHVALSPRML